MKPNKLLNSFLWSSIALLSISSCTDYNTFTEGEIQQALYNQKYDEAFVERFGEIAANQSWGMDEALTPIVTNFSALSTRAGSPGQVNVQRNMWVERVDGSGTFSEKAYKATALAHNIQIPGWPHLNDIYYGSYGAGKLENTWTAATLPNGGQPVGDVTEYEIQYVSKWFRTHRNPKSINLHLSDFFIQNVSCDYDQVEYQGTCSSDDEICSPATGWNGENATAEDWSGISGIDNITRASGHKEVINYNLEYLGFMDHDGNWTHVNNFNNGNSNKDPEAPGANNINREIKYITSSGTENFTCRSSWAKEGQTFSETKDGLLYKWVLVHLTWTETVTHPDSPKYGEDIPREGYYLAFDFEGKKDGVEVRGDGYYSNWIIKITPGHFTPTGKAKRIMCEDLGGQFDFDFNDAVIDVAFESQGWHDGKETFQSIISVQAAGGTMPIYVEHKDDNFYEIHNILGADTKTPINVDKRDRSIAIYRGQIYDNTNMSNIQIWVNNTQNGTTYHLDGNNEERENLYPDSHEENPYGSPTHKIGTIAPRAFAVPTYVRWMKELQGIDNCYQNFKDWVGNPSWTSSAMGGEHWYELAQEPNKWLFSDKVILRPGSPTGTSTLPVQWIPLNPKNNNLEVAQADASLQFYKYDGVDDAMWRVMEKPEATKLTLIVTFKSLQKFDLTPNAEIKDATNVLKAIVIPADVIPNSTIDTKYPLYYNGTAFNKTFFTKYHQAEFQTSGNGDDADKDAEGYYTYIVTYSFLKDELKTNAPNTAIDSAKKWVDNIFVYYEAPNKGQTVNDKQAIKVADFYVHY